MAIETSAPPQLRAPPLQVVPPGLLSLLELKSLGRTPGSLQDSLVSVMEMREWYMTARRVTEEILFGDTPAQTPIKNLATGGTGFFAFVRNTPALPLAQVPAGQIWYIDRLTIFGTTAAAADTIRFAPVMNPQSAGSFSQVGPDYLDTVTARIRTFLAHNDRPFFAYGGDVFGGQVQDIVSAGLTLQLRLWGTPMKL